MIRRRSAVLVVGLTLACLPAPAQATFPGANGTIAFVRSGDIWTMNPDGSNQAEITNTAGATEASPAWSADGTQIAYIRDGAVWVMNGNGSGQHLVVPRPTDPSACGSGSSVLGQILGSVGWSPDDTKLAYHDFRSCRFDSDTEFDDSDLYTVNPDGTGAALLVQHGYDPHWSPDGGRIVYKGGCEGGGCPDLRWITPDGSSQFEVYNSNINPDSPLDWSPDASLIAGCGEGGFGHPLFYCFTIRPDGTGYHEFPSDVTVGRWSPDGTKFLLSGVYVENTDGSGKTQIASGGAADWQPIPYTGYPRPRGASPLRVSLVPAYKPCAAPNRTHGSPLAFPSCNPPQQESGSLTIGTPDANGQGAKSTPYVRFGVKASAPADVRIKVSISDVRNLIGLSDYTGELQEQSFLRVTDHNNGTSSAGGADAATTYGVNLPITGPCAATPDATIGGQCDLESTMNAVIPGSVAAGDRAVWELTQVQVFDGGPDGAVATGANTLFMVQGIFIP